MAKLTENSPGTVNLIAPSTLITGDIKSDTDIRVDGSLNGNLMTKGRLIVGKSGSITGEITCKAAEIEGKIDGKISVEELLSLKSTSVLSGEVNTKQLMIEPGALFTGNCKMKENSTQK